MFEQIIRFWFEETTPDKWWQKDDDFDAEIKRRFSKLHNQAKVGELFMATFMCSSSCLIILLVILLLPDLLQCITIQGSMQSFFAT